MTTLFPDKFVTLMKGSQVFSTNPSKREYVLKRCQKVNAHHYYPAVSSIHLGDPGSKAQVCWAGSGGYWCWTDCDNILTLTP